MSKKVSAAGADARAIPCVIYGAKSSDDIHGLIPTQVADCVACIGQDSARFCVGSPFTDEAKSASGNRGHRLAAAKDKVIQAANDYGYAELWVQHSDRIARGDGISADHLAEVWFALRRHQVKIRSVQDDSNLEYAIRVVLIGKRNHEDPERQSAATRSGKRHRFEKGKPVGGAPMTATGSRPS